MDTIECKNSCYWNYRFEILGLVLLFIATILTIVTFNSFGIAAMFIVGAALCCHKCLSCCPCTVCKSGSDSGKEELSLSLEPENKPVSKPIKRTPKI